MPFEILPDESTTSDTVKSIVRQPARTAANLTTRAIGLPGDILSLVNDLVAAPLSSAVTGQEKIPYEKTWIGKAIPTTEQHRQNLQSATGEFLKPQNDVEKFVDDVLEDTALLFVPSSRVAKGTKDAKGFSQGLRNLSKALGANLAGETVSQVTGNKTAGDLTKGGALFLSSLLDQPKVAKQVAALYQKAEQNLPKNAFVNASKFSNHIDKLERKITKGRPRGNLSATERFVIDQIDKARNLVQEGKLNVEQTWAQKRSLNQELRNLYKEVSNRGDQKSVKDLAKQLTTFFNEAIADYGKKNPRFYKPFKEADEAFGVLAKSNVISNWVDNHAVSSPLTHGLLHLFGSPIGGAVGKAIAPYEIGKITYRIAKSKALRNIYGRALKAAVKEDSIAFNKYLRELDRRLQKEENPGSRYVLID